jgi:hypothetical protein
MATKTIHSDATYIAHRVIGALTNFGPQTIDDLAALVSLGWHEVLLAVDRLSRDGQVALRRTADRRYLVLLPRDAAR